MSEENLDWSKPVEAVPLPRWAQQLSRVRPILGPIYDMAAVRKEQIRRAKFLLVATGAPPLRRENLEERFDKMAQAVPGLRYRFGSITVARLAPSADPDDVEGRVRGRPRQWTASRKQALAVAVGLVREGVVPEVAISAATDGSIDPAHLPPMCFKPDRARDDSALIALRHALQDRGWPAQSAVAGRRPLREGRAALKL